MKIIKVWLCGCVILSGCSGTDIRRFEQNVQEIFTSKSTVTPQSRYVNRDPVYVPNVQKVPRGVSRKMPLDPTVSAEVSTSQNHEFSYKKLLAKQDVLPKFTRYLDNLSFGDKNIEKAVREYYEMLQNRPVWFGPDGWTKRAYQLQKVLEESHYQGLFRDNYWDISWQGLKDKKDIDAMLMAEVLLTTGMIKFTHDVENGFTTNYEGIDFQIPKLVRKSLSGGFMKWITSLYPDNAQYKLYSKAMMNPALTHRQWLQVALKMDKVRGKDMPIISSKDHIIVNIPAFRLQANDKGNRQALDMPIVVGMRSRKTEILDDKITSLKFSPDWHVPTSIAKKDILPILKKDPKLLDEMKLIPIRNGKRKNIYKVNWKTVSIDNPGYRFKQDPGPENALGGVRFSTTNRYAIYLHDSPERNKFTVPMRAFSSGCVRVGDAVGLAYWIASKQKNTSLSRDQIISKMNKGKINDVKLETQLPVHFIYDTVWITHDKKVIISPDVYDYDILEVYEKGWISKNKLDDFILESEEIFDKALLAVTSERAEDSVEVTRN